jgi:hypothetical protein
MTIYEYVPHPHIERRKVSGPVKVADQHPTGTPFARFNTWLGLKITLLVGTMVCAYVFSLIALISLPSAITSGNLTIIVAWISSNFIQLVLLPIIIVGQNVQAAAADKRSEQTYKDAEAVLAEALKIQDHLCAQDRSLEEHRANLAGQEEALRGLIAALDAKNLTPGT